jgi:hypothetical protein
LTQEELRTQEALQQEMEEEDRLNRERDERTNIILAKENIFRYCD